MFGNLKIKKSTTKKKSKRAVKSKKKTKISKKPKVRYHPKHKHHKKVKKEIKKHRENVRKVIKRAKHPRKLNKEPRERIKTGVSGLDELIYKGIPRGNSILLAGGPGSGKTIFGLQTCFHGVKNGEKCLYMTFEESEEKLKEHMRNFGWDPDKYIKKGLFVIKRFDPFDVTRVVEAMLEKAKGELLVEAAPVSFPKGFKPQRIVVDSLSAIAAAFVGKEENYRLYIEQLFRYFEKLGATSFLITETTAIPVKYSVSGVEEFLADGVIVLYNVKKGNIRESAIEVLKLRGTKHKKKIVAMEIIDGKGIVVYPEQELISMD